MVIHGEEALLAVGFIFTFHFFHTHLRPESFPLDTKCNLKTSEDLLERPKIQYDDKKSSN
jgi:hypothetical protein